MHRTRGVGSSIVDGIGDGFRVDVGDSAGSSIVDTLGDSVGDGSVDTVGVADSTGDTVGVGPYAGPPLSGDHWDPVLLAEGDRRNVVDRYRYWRHEAIVADLDTRRHPFHVAVENWGHDFNIGSVIRTANAFNAAAFHIVGRRRWNRRGAMVTDRYQHEHHHVDPAALAAWAASQDPGHVVRGVLPTAGCGHHSTKPAPVPGEVAQGAGAGGIPLIGIDNVPGSVALEAYDLPRACVLVFGQEGPGLTPGMQQVCRVVLHIEQFGSTRSINAGAAAAIAMHAWVRRHVFDQRP